MLRVGVFGAGPMGVNHMAALARCGAAGQGVARLVGVADVDGARAAAAAVRFGVAAMDGAELLGKIDAAVIASSSHTHLPLGLMALEAGVACLIEKPLALTRADCEGLILAAQSAGALLAVGHIERWNPAVVAAVQRLRGQPILAIDARRFNPGSARITDSDVVIDLMIHDLDLVRMLLGGAAPVMVQACGRARVEGRMLDHVTALLRFDGSVVASVAASRMMPDRIREVRVLTGTELLEIDCLQRRLWRCQPDGQGRVALEVTAGDALEAEQACFLEAVAARRLNGGVTGPDALASLELAWMVQDLGCQSAPAS